MQDAAIYISKKEKWAFFLSIAIFLLALYQFIDKDNPIPLLGVLSLFSVFILLLDYRSIYFLFFLTIPYSIEFSFSQTLGTDLPSEPIMWLLFGIGILSLITRGLKEKFLYLDNPITILIILHVIAIFFTSLFSQDHILSFKYFIAKLWYIIPFFFLPLNFINTEIVIKLFKVCIWSLAIGIMITIFRHSLQNFTFDSINLVMKPFFRNHVSYAAIAVLVLPFVWAMFRISTNKMGKLVYGFLILLYILAISLSYTRAAMGSIVLAVAAYYIFQWKLIKQAIIASVMVVMIGGLFLYNNNAWLDLAPNFEKTISHDEFGNLISATYKLEDISSMERIHRWVAGVAMVEDKPIFGFGPSTFYSFYKPYTLTSFQTYVSDNPEHSGIHNYYLMVLVEQGIFGFLIFISLVITTLLYGEKVYHLTKSLRDKTLVMASLLCVIIVLILNTMNDLLEVDKVGFIFFFCLSLLVYFGRKTRFDTNLDQ
ncbi:MAG: O-antigen ligase family protein [Saprospiraceae bacterium]|nr:O-antigen ligase family protein [Saprospiraceae bacterium]MCB9328887.1 O-antigen ligase family protein [Lewinellaceae bacterium]